MLHILVLHVLLLACASSALHASGALFVRPVRSQQTHRAMTIKHYDATIQIRDHVATTHIDQVFYNSMNTIVESTLVFPLPPGAIITDMAYWFNGKRYVADVRERKAAQAAYDAKVRALVDPALLKEVGENTFQLNIAPINALSDVRAEITYVEILPYAASTLSCTHLLRSTSVSPTPLERVTIRANVQSQYDIRSIAVPNVTQSVISITKESNREYNILYGDENALPTRHLRIDVGMHRTDAAMNVATYQPTPADSLGTDGFFATFVTPPDESITSLPRSIVVLADVSSSMTELRMQHLRTAMHAFIDRLSENDMFNLVTFSTNVVRMSPDLVPVNPQSIDLARKFIDSRSALGLTNMSDALKAALSMSFRPNTANIVVLLTDGDPSWGVTNHADLVDSVRAWNTQHAQIYPIAIGEEPTDALLKGIAFAGGGYLTRIDRDDSIAIVVEHNIRRISMPLMTDAALDYGRLHVKELVPITLPNVAAGERLIQVGRYAEPQRTDVRFVGRVAADTIQLYATIEFGMLSANQMAVARLWAMFKIEQLLEEIARYGERKELVDAVIALSIRFRILTRYTALYADPDKPTSVDGWPDDRPIEVLSLHCAPMPITSEFTVRTLIPLAYVGCEGTLELIDISGRHVATLAIIPRLESELHLNLNLSQIQSRPRSGTYLLVFRVGNHLTTTPVIINETI